MTSEANALSEQRDGIDKKYDSIYWWLAYATRQLIQGYPQIPPPQRYEILKDMLPGLWTVLMRLAGGPIPPLQELVNLAGAANAEPVEWEEAGTPQRGTDLGYSRRMDTLVLKTLRHHVPAECDLVLDLGCGWGHRMFDSWRAGIAPDAQYFGGDRSLNSKQLVDDLAALLGATNIHWFPFNFMDPNFDGVTGSPAQVVVFTCHAIEQVKLLGPALFSRIIERFPNAAITGIHVEPITFQLEDDDDGTDRRYAVGHAYNLDLVQQVKSQPKFEIAAVEKRQLDHKNGNATSVLIWKRKLADER